MANKVSWLGLTSESRYFRSLNCHMHVLQLSARQFFYSCEKA